MAIFRPECRLPFVSLPEPDAIVSVLQVQLAEDPGSVETVQQFTDQGQWVAVLDSDVVQASVVDTESEGPILLGNKQDGSAGRACGFADNALIQRIRNECIQGLLLGRCE